MEEKQSLDDVLNDVIEPKDPEPSDKEDVQEESIQAEETLEVEPGTDDPKTEDNDDGSDGDDDPEKTKDETKKPDKNDDSSVIRDLRKKQRESSDKVKQYDQMLDKLAKQKGITKDELIEELQAEADVKEAKEKNISPEIQKQLREQQEALDKLTQERERSVFNTKFDKLTEDYPMDNTQAREFVQKALDMGVDLGNPNTDFKAIYIALNHESIITKAREEERQNTLKRIEDQGKKSPGLTKKRNQSDGTKKGTLDDALADILGT